MQLLTLLENLILKGCIVSYSLIRILNTFKGTNPTQKKPKKPKKDLINSGGVESFLLLATSETSQRNIIFSC